ncbi:MAG: radical SAM protein [Eggerthellaceae bacterium]|nr:radical SAM protein [Eggerthellaceae bacterium]
MSKHRGNYGRITSIALDPIEKKPLSRFYPGTTVLSVGSYGCTMDCPFCQNDSIAKAGENDVTWWEMQPEELVQRARDLSWKRCIGIAYTYNEPLRGWRYVRDTGRLAHEWGLKNVLVSNGLASPYVLGEVAPYIDAANIDLKCFTEEGYRWLRGDLNVVKRTIQTLAELDTCHIEVTTLVVPGLSDDPAQIDAMTRWLASLDPNIPYHLSRYFPRHRMRDVPATSVPLLYELADVARNNLTDVILGNV